MRYSLATFLFYLIRLTWLTGWLTQNQYLSVCLQERDLTAILEVIHRHVSLSFDWTVVKTSSTIMSTAAVADRGKQLSPVSFHRLLFTSPPPASSQPITQSDVET